MSARSILPLGILCVLIFTCASARGQEPGYPEPVGWEDMDETRRQEYRDLWDDFHSQRRAAKLTDEEKDSLTQSEKQAVNQAMWSLRGEFRDLLAARGFELRAYRDMDIEAEVNRARPANTGEPDAAAGVTFDEGGDDVVLADVGSIIYDNGNPATIFGGGAIIGNRFNTHDAGNPVFMSGTVSTIVAVVRQGPAFTTSSAGFVLLGPQTGGGGAMAIFSTFTNATGMTDTVTFTGIGANYTGSSFFVLFGDFSNSYVPAFSSGSNGQGFHGVVGYTGMMGPNITGTFDFGGARNALVRATGNIRTPIPVELMKFNVESTPAKD